MRPRTPIVPVHGPPVRGAPVDCVDCADCQGSPWRRPGPSSEGAGGTAAPRPRRSEDGWLGRSVGFRRGRWRARSRSGSSHRCWPVASAGRRRTPPRAFLDAMAGAKSVDPAMALLLKAIKATAKDGIGKLRQRSRGQVPFYEPWPALDRKTWRPDIRAAVLSTVRVIMHRKMMKTAAAADIYPARRRHRLHRLPLHRPVPAGPPPVHARRQADHRHLPPRRLGVSPGMVKHEGTQTVLWGRGAVREERRPVQHRPEHQDVGSQISRHSLISDGTSAALMPSSWDSLVGVLTLSGGGVSVPLRPSVPG